jgi:rubredoxin
MKNFDHPYIDDSPIDLSGIEGAPRPWTCDDCGAEVKGDDDHHCPPATRTFTDVLDEWTSTVLKLNKDAVSIEALGLIARLGTLGQRLITEANVVGMTEIAKEYK